MSPPAPRKKGTSRWSSTMVAPGTRLICTAPAAHAAVIGAQLVWSSWTVLSKRLMDTGSDPIIFATCRELGCASVLFMATAVQRWVSREPSFSYTRREAFLLVCCGMAMGAMQLTFLLGVRKVDATTASLSNLLIPILTLVTTGVLGWEPLPLCGARCSALCPSYTKVAGVLCACAGCAVLIYNPTGALDAPSEGEMQYLVGCAFLLLSSCGSVAFVLTQKALLRRHGELEVLAAAYALACVSLVVACAAYYMACKQAPAMALGRFTLGREELVALAFTVSFVGVGAYCLFTYANQRLPSTLLTLYGIVQPLLTSLMAYAVLGEAPRSACLAGASLIVLGLMLTAVATVATPPRSELEKAPGMAPDLAAPLLPVNYSRHYDHSRHATSFPKPPPPPPRKLHATSFSKPPPPPPRKLQESFPKPPLPPPRKLHESRQAQGSNSEPPPPPPPPPPRRQPPQSVPKVRREQASWGR